MVDGRLLVEYSKSARAACPLCGLTIPKGVVRIGRESMMSGWPQTKWHHPNCFVEHHPEADIEQMSGFLSLKAADQKALRVIRASVEKENGHMTTSSQIVQSGAAKVVVVKTLTVTTGLNNFHPSKLSKSYKDIRLPEGWKAFSSVILNEVDNIKPSEKIAAFDFDGTLVDTSVFRTKEQENVGLMHWTRSLSWQKWHGADAWSLLYTSIPAKLAFYHDQGYKLVIFTNESNIDRFTKARAKAIDSKVGRLKGFMQAVKVPLQVFIACGRSDCNDAFRKPATGMWHLLEDHLNGGIPINKQKSFYVGDAAGRKTDHSDADIGFAKGLGLNFLLPEDVFLHESHVIADQSHGEDTSQEQEQEANARSGMSIELPMDKTLKQSSPETP